MIQRVFEELGGVDILVNNAGVNVRGPIDKLSLEDFQKVQQTNVTGPWLLCRALAAHFKERRAGRVINIGSTLSIVSMPDRTPYATAAVTSGGRVGVVKLLRARGGCLGVISSSGVEGCDKSGGAAQRASIPESPSNPGN